VAEFRADRGVDLTGPFIPMLRSPELMTRAAAMGQYLRYRSEIPPRLSEFVILMTSRRWSQQYQWAVHQPFAIEAGLSQDVVRAIAEGRRPDDMTDDEATLYDFCDELATNQSVSDPTYARMIARFGERGVVDTVGIVGYYTMLAMMLNTARVPPAPGKPLLPILR